jgi:hypothetical protein
LQVAALAITNFNSFACLKDLKFQSQVKSRYNFFFFG